MFDEPIDDSEFETEEEAEAWLRGLLELENARKRWGLSAVGMSMSAVERKIAQLTGGQERDLTDDEQAEFGRWFWSEIQRRKVDPQSIAAPEDENYQHEPPMGNEPV